MNEPHVTRRISWMDLQADSFPSGEVLLPTMWDSDGPGRVRVGVEIFHDGEGGASDFVVSSEDSHILLCQQQPGPEPLG